MKAPVFSNQVEVITYRIKEMTFSKSAETAARDLESFCVYTQASKQPLASEMLKYVSYLFTAANSNM